MIIGSSSGAVPLPNKNNIGVAFSSGGAAFDDTDLKAYWKFAGDDTPIVNSSESDESLGSNADMAITNGSYETGSPPVNDGAVFFNDASSAYGIAGTSTSQWNFHHNTSPLFTWVVWIKFVSIGHDDFFFADGVSSAQYFRMRLSGDNAFELEIKSDGNTMLAATTSNDSIPDTTNWHMYSFSFDFSLANTNYVFRRDNANEETFNKSASTGSDSNATYSAQMARKTDGTTNYGDFYISEFSCWNRILTDDELTELYNDGNGKAIY